MRLYVEEGPRIFSRSLGKRITSVDGLLDERYSNEPLREVLERYLGETTVDQALTDVFVTTYDLHARKPKFFKSWREDAGLPMAVAAEATAAAPTYFEPVAVGDAALIDGGVFAGNPAMCAYAEAVRLRPGDATTLVSLGTGSQTSPIPLDKARGWGVLEWARPIIDVVFDGSSDAVDYQLEHVLGERYVRAADAPGGRRRRDGRRVAGQPGGAAARGRAAGRRERGGVGPAGARARADLIAAATPIRP